MKTKDKKIPLLKCEMVHNLPGRVRIRCRALKYLSKYEKDLIANFKEVEYIKDIKVSTKSFGLLVYYNMDSVTCDEVLEMAEAIISFYSLEAYKKEREANNYVKVQERRLQEETPKQILKRIAITGVGLLSSFRMNQELLPNNGFLSRFTTIPSILSLALSKDIFKSGVDSVLETKRPNADTLTMASIITALVTSRGTSALMTILLSDIAELMTAYTMVKTRNAIKDMIQVGEKEVWIKDKFGSLTKKSLQDVKENDIIVGQTGDKISVDGIVEDGEAIVDQSPITGEFMPVVRKKGESVFAGTIIKNGNLDIRAQKVGDETAVARIVHMVEEAPNNKAQIQVYADRFSAQLIPINFALAGLVYLTTRSVTRALNMMIIDYSCGVRLSTATALSASIHTAAKNGILLKGGNLIESMAEADTLILDKTGTMTEGKPKLVSIIPAKDIKEKDLLLYAAAAEETSTHPLAHSILSKIRKSGWKIPNHSETKVVVARGVETQVDGKTIRVGNKKFMLENDIKVDNLEDGIQRLVERGENVIFVSVDDYLAGVLGVQDPLRENMKKSLNRLRYLGFDDMKLLTGDLAGQARIVASKMALDEFESELLPEDKAKEVLNLQARGSKVIMIGDGINDALALAYADVGITLGDTRTDVAIEASDVTIMQNDPMLIPSTVNLSRDTMSIVKQNFATTVLVNTVGLFLGAIGVLPVFWGAVLHNMTTIAVVGNSARILFYDVDKRR